MAGKGGRRRTTRIGVGAGQGDGWGGPARGAGSGSERAPPISAEHQPARLDARTAAERKRLRELRADAMEDALYALAIGADSDMTRVHAAARLHAICDGLPIARTEHSGSLTLEQLVSASLAKSDGQ